MKINIIGVASGILALVTLALPWWSMSTSAGTIDLYLWGASGSQPAGAFGGNWLAYISLIIVACAGIVGILGGVKVETGETRVKSAAILDFTAIILFIIGFWLIIPNGTAYLLNFSADRSAYLSYGFWLALVSGIIAIIAYKRHPPYEEVVS